MQTPEAKNAVDKALKLLFLIAEIGRDGSVRISDLVERSQLSRPTVHRHLNSLIAFRLVEQSEERGYYRLGSGVLALSTRMTGRLGLKERALPYLRELSEQTRVTVHLGIRDGNSALYMEKIESEEPIRLASAVGQSSPLHSSGIGKALLAFSGEDVVARYIAAGLKPIRPNTITTENALREEIARIRKRGYAVDNEENEAGVRCIAAPVFDHDEHVIASISIAATVYQISRRDVATLAPLVVECARRISRNLGYDEPPQD